PLVTGFSQTSTDTQRAAVALADQTGASIDTGATAVTRALQQVGEATCTLGEVRSRADLIIYWGAADLLSNARHRQSLVTTSPEITRKTVAMGEAGSLVSDFADEC
ncbi:MAG TPA: formylmethanofuran dehydrogenase subunit B, partial [Gimesia maris]|nr:formylmethanofuran dehydrogenase subunit B [Gimesia maris]